MNALCITLINFSKMQSLSCSVLDIDDRFFDFILNLSCSVHDDDYRLFATMLNLSSSVHDSDNRFFATMVSLSSSMIPISGYSGTKISCQCPLHATDNLLYNAKLIMLGTSHRYKVLRCNAKLVMFRA